MIEIERVSHFIGGLQATMETAAQLRSLYNRDLSIEFNPLLHFFSINENKLSQILAFFLDPKETHGQGDIYLKAFVASLENQISYEYSTVNISCEHATNDNRRIDLLIDFDNGKYGICIENKIWAIDQHRQIADYNSYLVETYRDSYQIIYMPPYHRTPNLTSISNTELQALIDNKRYSCIDHSTGTSKLIETWISITRSSNVRQFLKDLYQNIQYHINGERVMGQNDLIAKFVTSSTDKLETYFELSSARNAVFEELISTLRTEIYSLGKLLNLKLDKVNICEEAYSGFTFIFEATNGTELWIRYEFDSRWYNDFFFGILTPHYNSPEFTLQLTAALGKSDDEGPNQHWAWWQWHKHRNWGNDTFLDIQKGNFIEDVRNELIELLPKLSELLTK